MLRKCRNCCHCLSVFNKIRIVSEFIDAGQWYYVIVYVISMFQWVIAQSIRDTPVYFAISVTSDNDNGIIK